jgi:predicted nucleic acid-binding Zn ribbon protein
LLDSRGSGSLDQKANTIQRDEIVQRNRSIKKASRMRLGLQLVLVALWVFIVAVSARRGPTTVAGKDHIMWETNLEHNRHIWGVADGLSQQKPVIKSKRENVVVDKGVKPGTTICSHHRSLEKGYLLFSFSPDS